MSHVFPDAVARRHGEDELRLRRSLVALREGHGGRRRDMRAALEIIDDNHLEFTTLQTAISVLEICLTSKDKTTPHHRETQVSYIDRRLKMTSNDVYKLMLYGIGRTLRTRPFNRSEVIFKKWNFVWKHFCYFCRCCCFQGFVNAVLLVYIRKK